MNFISHQDLAYQIKGYGFENGNSLKLLASFISFPFSLSSRKVQNAFVMIRENLSFKSKFSFSFRELLMKAFVQIISLLMFFAQLKARLMIRLAKVLRLFIVDEINQSFKLAINDST